MHNLSARLLIIGVAAAVVLDSLRAGCPARCGNRCGRRPGRSRSTGSTTGRLRGPAGRDGYRPRAQHTGPIEWATTDRHSDRPVGRHERTTVRTRRRRPQQQPGLDRPGHPNPHQEHHRGRRDPGRIPVTGPVAINVRFGGRVVDQTYAAGTGNRILHNYGVGGPARHETVNVRLVESATGLVYAMDLTLTIEPLYDVTIGALHFEELAPCDLIAEADPEIGWRNAEGKIRNAEPEVVDGTAKVDNFADTYTEVALANGLLLPEVRWWDGDLWLDFHGFNFGAIAEQAPPTHHLSPHLLGTGRGRRPVQRRFSYELTVQLRWYPNL